MCENYVIKAKPTTSHNPQANAMIEWVHKAVNEMLRSFDLEKENLEEDNPFEYFSNLLPGLLEAPTIQHYRLLPVS
jgi:hypothetical protein